MNNQFYECSGDGLPAGYNNTKTLQCGSIPEMVRWSTKALHWGLFPGLAIIDLKSSCAYIPFKWTHVVPGRSNHQPCHSNAANYFITQRTHVCHEVKHLTHTVAYVGFKLNVNTGHVFISRHLLQQFSANSSIVVAQLKDAADRTKEEVQTQK